MRNRLSLFTVPYVVWMALLVVAPVIMVVIYAFTSNAGSFTLDNFSDMGAYVSIFSRSFQLAIVATLVCLLIGYPVAYAMAKEGPGFQRIAMVLIMLPMWVNFLLRTYSWMAILENNGLLNQFFSDNLSERADYKKDYLDFNLLGEDTIPQLTQELIRAFTVKRIGYQFDVYSSLLRLFAALENPDIYKAAHISLRNSQELLTAEQVKKLIETHHGAIQRTNLAEALNYSCEHISRIIKTNTGYTLKAYCQKVQMAEAARLLRTTELPVCQIAASMGYENRTQFYKVFRREYGLTPLEYRRHIAEE